MADSAKREKIAAARKKVILYTSGIYLSGIKTKISKFLTAIE